MATQDNMLDQTQKNEDKKADPNLEPAGQVDPNLTLPSYFGGLDRSARFKAKNNPIDAKKYDYQSKRTTLTMPNNLIESMVHMLMYGIGGGLVVLHAAYMECGIFLAIGINLFLAIFIGYCACLLVWSAQKLYGRVQMAVLSYPDIIEATILLSPWNKFRKTARGARYILEGTLMMHLYGSCCVFIIMIARALKELVTGDHTISDDGNPPLKVYIISLMVPCVVISMIIDLKTLAPFALVCNLYAFALILVLLWYSFHNMVDSPLDRAPYKSVMGGFEFVSVCVFVLEPVCYSLAIENNMQDPTKFHYVVLGSMPVYTACMVTVGFFGYWYYGENCVSPITIHYPYSAFAVIMKVFLCINLYVVYAMCFHVAFDVEWFYLKRNHQVSNYWFWERLYRTLHVVVLILISYVLPNVTRMMGVLGGLFTTPAVMIYPAIIELILDWEYPGLGRYKWRLVKCISMVIVGLTALFGGTYFNIVGMVKEVRLQNIGAFTPNYTHGDQDDDWKSKFVRTDTEVYPSIYIYNNSNANVHFYDTMSKNTTHALRNYNASSLLLYNKSYVLPVPIIRSLKNVDLNNSAENVKGLRNDVKDIVVIDNKTNTKDGSTTATSNDVLYITPGKENTNIILNDKNTIADESTVGLGTDVNTIQTGIKNNEELSTVTGNMAPVVEDDTILTNDTQAISGEIDKNLSNMARMKIDKSFDELINKTNSVSTRNETLSTPI